MGESKIEWTDHYTVTCDGCGRVVASGVGRVASWEQPHVLTCAVMTVTVVWIVTATLPLAQLKQQHLKAEHGVVVEEIR